MVAEVFTRKRGTFAGSEEVLNLFRKLPNPPQVEALAEGESFEAKEVLMRISGTYESFGLYETVLLGMLASSTGWATAAKECVEAAEGRSVLCFGARHVHPAIAPVMERAAKIAGCSAMSCILAAVSYTHLDVYKRQAVGQAGDKIKYDDYRTNIGRRSKMR